VFPLYLAILLWRQPNRLPKRRYTLPLLYAVILVAAIAGFYYWDSRSVDAHLARANRAKLREDTAAAIREYRQALALEDDPHTHKLLGIELSKVGNTSEANSEFCLAKQGGEPDVNCNR
jgi:Flp pilus assembly protein TadD